MSKRFTLSEAGRLLPKVGKWVGQAVTLKSEYERAEQTFQDLLQHLTLMGGVVVDRDRARADKARRDQCAQRLKSTLERIQETGCLVKDLDTGLVDFPTVFRGEEVYLCWKIGEPEIGFWHGVNEGFAGRKPIDEDFRRNHGA